MCVTSPPLPPLSLSSPSPSPPSPPLQEVHKVLGVVVQCNQVAAASHLSQELFESWRQLVETTLHAMLQDDVKRELKVAVLFELIQDLLLKVRTQDNQDGPFHHLLPPSSSSSPSQVEQCESPALTTSVHGVILILLAHLRQAVLSSHTPSDTEGKLKTQKGQGSHLVVTPPFLVPCRLPAALTVLWTPAGHHVWSGEEHPEGACRHAAGEGLPVRLSALLPQHDPQQGQPGGGVQARQRSEVKVWSKLTFDSCLFFVHLICFLFASCLFLFASRLFFVYLVVYCCFQVVFTGCGRTRVR